VSSRTRDDDPSKGALGELANAFAGIRVATLLLDRNLLLRDFSKEATEFFDVASPDRGRPFDAIPHRLDGIDFAAEVRRALAGREQRDRVVRCNESFLLVRILPYCTIEAVIEGVMITLVDLTALVAAENQQRLLVRELNHRVRNMLQVVMGVANQTLHRSADLREFETAYFGRVQALAQAYELLSREGWRNVPLADLVKAQLTPFAAEGNRYTAGGLDIVLRPNAALSLGLVLYEFATNATKYGALSVASGRVDVAWTLELDDEQGAYLVLTWTESGGPSVSPPTRHGFGSELVHRQLRHELRGESTLEFASTGLIGRLRIPIDEVTEGNGADGI
jgi:two-component system CheB/CheR fusion protein